MQRMIQPSVYKNGFFLMRTMKIGKYPLIPKANQRRRDQSDRKQWGALSPAAHRFSSMGFRYMPV